MTAWIELNPHMLLTYLQRFHLMNTVTWLHETHIPYLYYFLANNLHFLLRIERRMCWISSILQIPTKWSEYIVASMWEFRLYTFSETWIEITFLPSYYTVPKFCCRFRIGRKIYSFCSVLFFKNFVPFMQFSTFWTSNKNVDIMFARLWYWLFRSETSCFHVNSKI